MSSLPLYNLEGSNDYLLPQKVLRDNAGHAGLFFDKFCDTWLPVSESEWKMDGDSKLNWINKFTTQSIGKRHVIQESVKRLMRLIDKRCGRVKIFKSEYHFVTGLGRSHPVENGFTWHPVLGTPYLPGSSIKGLVRSWAENKELGPIYDDEALEHLLGSSGKTGGICFLDAIPTEPVVLKADVMTPHYAKWDKENPPGDWCPPTPIPFLVMEKQTSFLFGIIPHGAVEDDDLDKIMDCLQKALIQSGGGAKTAVGYGRFGYNREETDKWHSELDKERMQVEAQKSPEGSWRLKLRGKSETDILGLVREYLQKEHDHYLDSDVERCAFVRAVLSDYKQLVCKWKTGKLDDSRTNLGKKKLKERVNLLTNAASACGLPIAEL